jgi:hypothetical protein
MRELSDVLRTMILAPLAAKVGTFTTDAGLLVEAPGPDGDAISRIAAEFRDELLVLKERLTVHDAARAANSIIPIDGDMVDPDLVTARAIFSVCPDICDRAS